MYAFADSVFSILFYFFVEKIPPQFPSGGVTKPCSIHSHNVFCALHLKCKCTNPKIVSMCDFSDIARLGDRDDVPQWWQVSCPYFREICCQSWRKMSVMFSAGMVII